MEKVLPFLMFQDGNAEEAMIYYTSIFEEAKITSIVRYGANEPGEEGKVMQATFSIKGQEIMCIDSNIKHQFSFTPSISIFVICSTDKEIDRLFYQLIEDGQALMPLGDYGFSKKFGWLRLNDRFGVSWQLNLPR